MLHYKWLVRLGVLFYLSCHTWKVISIFLIKDSVSTQDRKNKNLQNIIRPVATYRPKSWPLNKDVTERLGAFERKVVRRMFGGIKVNENWRQHYIIRTFFIYCDLLE
jgi:hypothetical protein